MQKSAEMLRGYVRDIINCSFVAKLSWKKNIFFEKMFVFFTEYTLIAEKSNFIWEKKFILIFFFFFFVTEKNFFTVN